MIFELPLWTMLKKIYRSTRIIILSTSNSTFLQNIMMDIPRIVRRISRRNTDFQAELAYEDATDLDMNEAYTLRLTRDFNSDG